MLYWFLPHNNENQPNYTCITSLLSLPPLPPSFGSISTILISFARSHCGFPSSRQKIPESQNYFMLDMNTLTQSKSSNLCNLCSFLYLLRYVDLFSLYASEPFTCLLIAVLVLHVCFHGSRLHFSIILIPFIWNHHGFCRQNPLIHQSGTDRCAVAEIAFIGVNLRFDRF